jgi:hypothetical protein
MRNEGTLPELQEMTERLVSQELSPLPSVADLQLRNRRRRRLALGSLTASVAVAAAVLGTLLAVPGGATPAPHWALAGEISPSWAQVPSRGLLSGFSLTCPNATTCYAEGASSVGGSVELTRDGGKTWHLAPTKGGTPISNVACSSVAQCAFVEVGATSKPVFFETADGGRTWASHPAPAKLSHAYGLTKTPSGPERDIGQVDLSCASASTCTVVASSSGQLSLSGAFVTKDGGRTWSASHMPITPYQVQCFPDARCVSTGEASASYSTDNGLEWSPASLPAGPLAFLRSLGGLGSLSCSRRFAQTGEAIAVRERRAALRMTLSAPRGRGRLRCRNRAPPLWPPPPCALRRWRRGDGHATARCPTLSTRPFGRP